MANDYHEKDFNDEVYEDDFYEKHYKGDDLEAASGHLDDEELRDEDLGEDEKAEEEDDREIEEFDELDWEDEEKKITVSYACDECDYRWDDIVVRKKGEAEEESDIICPMCGSMNVTLI
jgi:DNA-directed RNA polymerase subunit M/transcription elongation factor TFIIS